MIAKVSLEDKASIIVKEFFDLSNPKKRKVDIVSYIRSNFDLSEDTSLSDAYVKWGILSYNTYCLYTHATNYAQQDIVPINNFYEILKQDVIELLVFVQATLKLAQQLFAHISNSAATTKMQFRLESITSGILNTHIATMFLQADEALTKLDTARDGKPILVDCIETTWIKRIETTELRVKLINKLHKQQKALSKTIEDLSLIMDGDYGLDK